MVFENESEVRVLSTGRVADKHISAVLGYDLTDHYGLVIFGLYKFVADSKRVNDILILRVPVFEELSLVNGHTLQLVPGVLDHLAPLTGLLALEGDTDRRFYILGLVAASTRLLRLFPRLLFLGGSREAGQAEEVVGAVFLG